MQKRGKYRKVAIKDRTSTKTTYKTILSDMETMTTAVSTKQKNTQGNAIVPTDIKETDTKTDNEITEMKLVEQAFIYVTRRKYPLGCSKNEKRSIRSKAERLKTRDGDLLYKKKDRNMVSSYIYIYIYILISCCLYLVTQVKFIISREDCINSEDCICRMLDFPGVQMVECTKCKQCYHIHCVTVPTAAIEGKIIDWFVIIVLVSIMYSFLYTCIDTLLL